MKALVVQVERELVEFPASPIRYNGEPDHEKIQAFLVCFKELETADKVSEFLTNVHNRLGQNLNLSNGWLSRSFRFMNRFWLFRLKFLCSRGSFQNEKPNQTRVLIPELVTFSASLAVG